MTTRTCATCAHPVLAGDVFCESCGRSGAPATPARTGDGGPAAAGASDVGHRRRRNEDAFAVEAGSGGVAAVVCDGVASTPDADRAAAHAATAAMRVLRRAVQAEARDRAAMQEHLARAV
ncbi:MAG: protein phosphatase 2C domain-containing protein, partial [Actinomycetes bacterium]